MKVEKKVTLQSESRLMSRLSTSSLRLRERGVLYLEFLDFCVMQIRLGIVGLSETHLARYSIERFSWLIPDVNEEWKAELF